MSDSDDLKAIKIELANKEAELKGMLSEVDRVNKEFEQFANVVSHDLRAPLRGIHNLADWIKEDLEQEDTENCQKNLTRLQKSVSQMHDMIDGILKFSKATSGMSEREEVDLEILLNEILDELAIPPGFSIKISSNLPVISSNRTKIKQVLSNLINNSMFHHDREDGKISVSVEENEKAYEFVVRDDGPGIAPVYHKKIFNIFYTIDVPSKKLSTGIGLAIVEKIVSEFDGVVDLESDIGKGASFKFTHRKYQ